MKTLTTCLIMIALAGAADASVQPDSYYINADVSREYAVQECFAWVQGVGSTPLEEWVGYYPRGADSRDATGVYEIVGADGVGWSMAVQATVCKLVVALVQCLTTQTFGNQLDPCVDAKMAIAPPTWDDATGEMPRISSFSDPVPPEVSDIDRGDRLYFSGWPSVYNHWPADIP